MKVGAKPANPLEWLLFKTDQVPLPLVDTFLAMMNAKAILAANELGIFETLADGGKTAEQIASATGVAIRGTSDLLEALCANGYIEKAGGHFELTSTASKWLVGSSPLFVGHMLQHINDLWPIWSNLEAAIRQGRPPASDYQDWLRNPKYREMLRRHILGLSDMVQLTAPELVRRIRISKDAKSLLDVGGGHGGYSVAFCQKHADLKATVFELEATAKIGKNIVAASGMSDRVEFRTGDFLNDDLGNEYDLALYFNIVHNFGESENRTMFRRIFDAMTNGGVLAVWDMFTSQDEQAEVQPALMALHMLVSSGGTSYPAAEVREWLVDAGFDKTVLRKTRTAPGLSLITCVKR